MKVLERRVLHTGEYGEDARFMRNEHECVTLENGAERCSPGRSRGQRHVPTKRLKLEQEVHAMENSSCSVTQLFSRPNVFKRRVIRHEPISQRV